MKRLLAIDPSLTCSGWALFEVDSSRLCAVGKIKALKSNFAMGQRLKDLHVKIETLYNQIKLGSNDVLIAEAPSTMRDPRAALAVEQVRGIFENLARSNGAQVPGRLNSRTVQYEVMGLKGAQQPRAAVKETALRLVSHAYKQALERLGFDTNYSNLKRNQDIVDAILIGNLGLIRIKSASDLAMDLTQFFAIYCTNNSRRRRYSGTWQS